MPDRSYLIVSDKVKQRLKSHEYAVGYVEGQREAIGELEAEIKRLRKRITMFERELEDIKITIGAMLDPDNPPLTADDFAKMKPARQR